MTQKKKTNISGLIPSLVLVLLTTISISALACNSSKSPDEQSKPNEIVQMTTENINNAPNLASEAVQKSKPAGLIPEEYRKTAPMFELPYVVGDNFSLAEFKGKLVLLDFTATWCHWCDRQAPQVEAVYKKFKGKGLEVVAIDCRESRETVLAKYPNGNKAYPIILDEQGAVFSMYSPIFNMSGYPTYILLDKEGKAAYIQSGYNENFEAIVSDLVSYLLTN
jgi:thiol-disulfide isomerase/thioredoxin